MNSNTITYIALGSNQGDKLNNLNQAILFIFERIGKIEAVSKVYKTPAWGFEGEDFLNACIEVSTRFSAEQLLHELLEIEIELGRIRIPQAGYQNRIIDLDIIFYGEEEHHSSTLQIPHPKLAERNFVLYPLKDIAPQLKHPLSAKSISHLVENSEDNSKIELVSTELELPTLPEIHSTYVAIEGNIGAGKTSLASLISEDYNAKLITERFKDNPFLPKFYEDQNRYAFPLEMSFLADRHQQLLDDISQYDLFSDFVVADYDVYKSLIFAKVTLQEDEYSLYKKVFDIMYKELPKPDLYVYLYQNTERLLENIKKRGRSYEQNIAPDYLEKINRGYLNFIKSQQQINIKIIDISDKDFVSNRSDYLHLLEAISKK
ncbi:2-amino-4-hydroxy-6-hydroxymethyldihydropteridine diphosphokinase [Psychroflexus planctonicus]|uniref:2-amino-4-hydroxy-6-hydroxymethyldihydropteridine pyrophosphokinase n=1 Tax=Psychroflexus planctonicus TaxID=1526575 RepID=A0ABQ1SIY2_9FLAO|nr:2-amino-4-hydroxy-6-hydroxymethyldihydropteridine diphosphokinase [Psychroflexus planctonicus]GGE36843.1 2-amino-4-hydroxy-6-hydroxymethyldihydropteridine diphosphokinase [Psychroflexus planctonicus]